jgi:hypothetical protein
MANVSHGTTGLSSQFPTTRGKIMDLIPNVNIDDLLVHSQTHEQHLNSLEKVMQRLEDNHMKIKLNKCFLAISK